MAVSPTVSERFRMILYGILGLTAPLAFILLVALLGAVAALAVAIAAIAP